MAVITNLGTKPLTRGALSKRTGCNIETIRYYEQIKIMPDPPRSDGGHRQYDEEHFKRLTFICRARELGFSIEEVRGLLALVDGGDYSCAEVQAMTFEHLNDIRRKIADLRMIENVLKDMVSQCDDGKIPECPVIEALFQYAAK